MNPESLTDTPLEHQLRSERVQLDPARYDQLRQRIERRVEGSPRPRRTFSRARLALTSMVAVGVLMSGTASTVAITGIAGEDSASVSQYGTPEDGGGGVLGRNEDGTNGGNGSTDDPAGSGAQSPESVSARPSEQVAAATDERLPFTGYVVFPLLLVGCSLTLVGVVLRRRTTTPG